MPADFAQLLGTTRGEVLSRLRAGPTTVNDIAAQLKLTDNAVRAHLAALEAEGLVAPAGFLPGVRKPHALFALTGRAREHFSRLYVPVLNALLSALGNHLSPEDARRLVENAGHALAAPHLDPLRSRPTPDRIAYALRLLTDLGAIATTRKEKSRTFIQGQGCPLSEAVSNHPDVCRLVETLLADLTGRPVHEHCERRKSEGGPRCCFEVG